MNSNERRLKVLYRLQSGYNVTVGGLSEEFKISKRTVYRDLRIITDLGVPITHDPDSGYGVLKDGMIPPIMFTFKELTLIVMGLSFVKSQIDQDMVDDAKNVLLKIKNAIPFKLQNHIDLLENHTLVSPYVHNLDYRDKGGDWYIFCEAFIERKPVSFFYVNKEKKRSKRVIDPHLLVHYTDHWNVIGFCHDKKTLRNFRLSQIEKPDIIENDNLLSPSRFDRDKLLYGRFDDNYVIEVHISKERAFEFLTDLPGKIKTKEDLTSSLKVLFSFDNLPFINEWLLRFGKDITIISPDSLKRIRKNYLKDLLLDSEHSVK